MIIERIHTALGGSFSASPRSSAETTNAVTATDNSNERRKREQRKQRQDEPEPQAPDSQSVPVYLKNATTAPLTAQSMHDRDVTSETIHGIDITV